MLHSKQRAGGRVAHQVERVPYDVAEQPLVQVERRRRRRRAARRQRAATAALHVSLRVSRLSGLHDQPQLRVKHGGANHRHARHGDGAWPGEQRRVVSGMWECGTDQSSHLLAARSLRRVWHACAATLAHRRTKDIAGGQRKSVPQARPLHSRSLGRKDGPRRLSTPAIVLLDAYGAHVWRAGAGPSSSPCLSLRQRGAVQHGACCSCGARHLSWLPSKMSISFSSPSMARARRGISISTVVAMACTVCSCCSCCSRIFCI